LAFIFNYFAAECLVTRLVINLTAVEMSLKYIDEKTKI
jgi:hypothetical protein